MVEHAVTGRHFDGRVNAFVAVKVLDNEPVIEIGNVGEAAASGAHDVEHLPHAVPAVEDRFAGQ